jgi:hypothetical protein
MWFETQQVWGIFFLQNAQTSSEAHTASHSTGVWGFFPEGKTVEKSI